MTTYNNFWFKGEESPDESWKPYYASLIEQVEKYSTKSDIFSCEAKTYRAENPTKSIAIVMGVCKLHQFPKFYFHQSFYALIYDSHLRSFSMLRLKEGA